MSLSSFSGNLDASRIHNLPNSGTSDWNTLLNKPSWVSTSRSNVTLSLLSGNLDASRINNLPTGGAATTWSTIEHPERTNQFSYSNIGPFISLSKITNFDIITNNSITPVSHQVYNLGRRFRRYNVVHTENLNLTTAIFDNNGVRQTYFSGSYNELCDLLSIPIADDSSLSRVKDTQDLVALSGFNKDLGWFDILNRPSWVLSTQFAISLSGFNKDLAWSDVQTKPS